MTDKCHLNLFNWTKWNKSFLRTWKSCLWKPMLAYYMFQSLFWPPVTNEIWFKLVLNTLIYYSLMLGTNQHDDQVGWLPRLSECFPIENWTDTICHHNMFVCINHILDNIWLAWLRDDESGIKLIWPPNKKWASNVCHLPEAVFFREMVTRHKCQKHSDIATHLPSTYACVHSSTINAHKISWCIANNVYHNNGLLLHFQIHDIQLPSCHHATVAGIIWVAVLSLHRKRFEIEGFGWGAYIFIVSRWLRLKLSTGVMSIQFLTALGSCNRSSANYEYRSPSYGGHTW